MRVFTVRTEILSSTLLVYRAVNIIVDRHMIIILITLFIKLLRVCGCASVNLVVLWLQYYLNVSCGCGWMYEWINECVIRCGYDTRGCVERFWCVGNDVIIITMWYVYLIRYVSVVRAPVCQSYSFVVVLSPIIPYFVVYSPFHTLSLWPFSYLLQNTGASLFLVSRLVYINSNFPLGL